MTAKRILVVEDDEDLAPVLVSVLVDEGYAVDLAKTREQAWDDLSRRRYDLVIADWKLPDGDGLLIADGGAALGAKTLVMSGYAFGMPADWGHGHQILIKPIRPGELADWVARAMGGGA